MASFPKLKTNAVAQYPSTRTLLFRNQAVRFVAGDQQRYRDSAGPLHQWEIRLSALDEGELAAIEQFFVDNGGSANSFQFTDPWDQTVYADCRIPDDDLQVLLRGSAACSTRIRIVENRNP